MSEGMNFMMVEGLSRDLSDQHLRLFSVCDHE